MSFEIYVRPEAESDIDEAYVYYSDIRQGLGDDFLLCLDDAIEKIRRMPQNYRVVY